MSKRALIACLFLSSLVFTPFIAHADEDLRAVLKLDKAYTDISKKIWNAKPGYEVVLATTQAKDGNVIVAVLKTSEKTELIANEKVALNEDCASPDKKMGNLTDCIEASLDLAPYRLNDHDVAIGIRWNQHQEFPAGEADDKQISLLLLKDGKLKSILDTDMNSESEQRTAEQSRTNKCTLSIAKTKTKDFFDIQKHCAITIKPLVDPEDGAPKAKVEKSIETTSFHWNGATYSEAKSAKDKK